MSSATTRSERCWREPQSKTPPPATAWTEEPFLNAAVENGYIGRNPVPREKLGGVEPRRDQHPLTFEEVHAVAETVPDRYRALIDVSAYGGLRWGEAAALRRGRCNLL